MSETTDPAYCPPTGTTSEEQQPRDALTRGFDDLRASGLHRDPSRSWIAGVSAGVATRLGVDPIVVRAGFVVLGLMGGAGVMVYLLAWALLPDERGQIVAERAIRQGDLWSIVLLGVTVLAVLLTFGVGRNGPGWWGLGWIALIAGAVYLFARHRPSPGAPMTYAPAAESVTGPAGERSASAPGASTGEFGSIPPSGTGYVPPQRYGYAPQPPPRPSRPWLGWPWFLLIVGLAVAGYGIGLAVGGIGALASGAQVGRLLALAIIGVALVITGLAGRRGALLSLVGLGLSGVVLLHTVTPVGSPTIGDQTWRPPATTSNMEYSLGIGSAVLDLRDLPTDPTGPVTIDAELGVGDLEVLVPDGLTAQLTTDVGAGYLGITDTGSTGASSTSENSGSSLHRVATFGTGSVDVDVHIHMGLGSVTITSGSAS
ncbi:MAG: PspC domain-containing protein [Nostocoides sp.]